MSRRALLGSLAVIGAGCVVAGVYVLLGLGFALIAGGVGGVLAGLLVDDGVKAAR